MSSGWKLLGIVGALVLLSVSTAPAQEAVPSEPAAVRGTGAERTRQRAVRNVEQAIATLDVAAKQANAAADTLVSATAPDAAALERLPGWFNDLVLPGPTVSATLPEAAAAARRSQRLADTLRTVQSNLIASLGRARELPADEAVRELISVPLPEAAITVIRDVVPNPDPFSPYVISYSNENYRMTLDYLIIPFTHPAVMTR